MFTTFGLCFHFRVVLFRMMRATGCMPVFRWFFMVAKTISKPNEYKRRMSRDN